MCRSGINASALMKGTNEPNSRAAPTCRQSRPSSIDSPDKGIDLALPPMHGTLSSLLPRSCSCSPPSPSPSPTPPPLSDRPISIAVGAMRLPSASGPTLRSVTHAKPCSTGCAIVSGRSELHLAPCNQRRRKRLVSKLRCAQTGTKRRSDDAMGMGARGFISEVHGRRGG